MTQKELKQKYKGANIATDVCSDLFQDDGNGEYSLSSDRYAGIRDLEEIFGSNASYDESGSEWDEDLYRSLEGTSQGKEYWRLFAPENQETISDHWLNDNIVFVVSVKTKDGKIIDVCLEKYQEGDGCRPAAKDKRIEKREIDIADRILDYITE